MNVFGVDHKMTKLIITICLLFCAGASHAEDILDYLTDKDGKYTGPTVEQNVAAMDTDKNGFADVLEVRAFLVLKHGKDYQKALLDRWEVRAMGGGCPIPFAKEFVSESVN
jgi:hypothetical protein